MRKQLSVVVEIEGAGIGIRHGISGRAGISRSHGNTRGSGYGRSGDWIVCTPGNSGSASTVARSDGTIGGVKVAGHGSECRRHCAGGGNRSGRVGSSRQRAAATGSGSFVPGVRGDGKGSGGTGVDSPRGWRNGATRSGGGGDGIPIQRRKRY